MRLATWITETVFSTHSALVPSGRTDPPLRRSVCLSARRVPELSKNQEPVLDHPWPPTSTPMATLVPIIRGVAMAFWPKWPNFDFIFGISARFQPHLPMSHPHATNTTLKNIEENRAFHSSGQNSLPQQGLAKNRANSNRWATGNFSLPLQIAGEDLRMRTTSAVRPTSAATHLAGDAPRPGAPAIADAKNQAGRHGLVFVIVSLLLAGMALATDKGARKRAGNYDYTYL
jgi:hypothetical protein